MSVVIETTLGDITVDLFTKERPRACFNFMKLCRMKYYNLCPIHRVEKDFIVQTGDPTGTGRGGESVFMFLYGDQARLFETEPTPKIKHTHLGTLSMVNDGNNLHGSQFFITLADELDYLDTQLHTPFGRVVEGFDVLKRFNETVCDNDHRPFQDIRIAHTVILEDPYEDPPGLKIPPSSPEPQEELLTSDRIALGEWDETEEDGKTEQERLDAQKDQMAKAEATILEMIGDLPDADMAPPENVLFVCKLNPVTLEDDLEVIFSRFGPVKNCEVIRDQKTGESLQYAFVEFGEAKHCEAAYFKMDNVLIDDRRIHVDFSQSVSRVKWRGKGRGVIHEKDNKEPATAKNTIRTGSGRLQIKSNAPRGRGNYDLVLEDDDDSEEDATELRQAIGRKGSDRTDEGQSRRVSSDDRRHHSDRDRHRSDRDRDHDRDRQHTRDTDRDRDRHRRHRSRSEDRDRKHDRHSDNRDRDRDRDTRRDERSSHKSRSHR